MKKVFLICSMMFLFLAIGCSNKDDDVDINKEKLNQIIIKLKSLTS